MSLRAQAEPTTNPSPTVTATRPLPYITLTQLCYGPAAIAEADRLKAILNGKTYMRLEVIAAPFGGSLIVSVQGDAESTEDLQGMVNMVLVSELLKATCP